MTAAAAAGGRHTVLGAAAGRLGGGCCVRRRGKGGAGTGVGVDPSRGAGGKECRLRPLPAHRALARTRDCDRRQRAREKINIRQSWGAAGHGGHAAKQACAMRA